jgi:hypothetical protein
VYDWNRRLGALSAVIAGSEPIEFIRVHSRSSRTNTRSVFV